MPGAQVVVFLSDWSVLTLTCQVGSTFSPVRGVNQGHLTVSGSEPSLITRGIAQRQVIGKRTGLRDVAHAARLHRLGFAMPFNLLHTG